MALNRCVATRRAGVEGGGHRVPVGIGVADGDPYAGVEEPGDRRHGPGQLRGEGDHREAAAAGGDQPVDGVRVG